MQHLVVDPLQSVSVWQVWRPRDAFSQILLAPVASERSSQPSPVDVLHAVSVEQKRGHVDACAETLPPPKSQHDWPLEVSQSWSMLQGLSHAEAQTPLPLPPLLPPPEEPTMPLDAGLLDAEHPPNHARSTVRTASVTTTFFCFISPSTRLARTCGTPGARALSNVTSYPNQRRRSRRGPHVFAPVDHRLPPSMRTLFSVIAVPLLLTVCACRDNPTAEAVTMAAAAGALTVANQVEDSRRARNAPVPGEYPPGCAASDCYVDADVSLEDARNYVLLYVNRVREARGVGKGSLDYALDAFAQAGSKQLARDPAPHRHIAGDAKACFPCAEVQSDPEGLAPAPVRDQLLGLLDGVMSQGDGASGHDDILAPAWHRLGTGIANPDGRTYVTLDLSP